MKSKSISSKYYDCTNLPNNPSYEIYLNLKCKRIESNKYQILLLYVSFYYLPSKQVEYSERHIVFDDV